MGVSTVGGGGGEGGHDCTPVLLTIDRGLASVQVIGGGDKGVFIFTDGQTTSGTEGVGVIG